MSRTVALLTCLALSAPALAQEQARIVPVPETEQPKEVNRFVPWVVPYVQLQTWVTLYDGDEDPQADPGGYGDPELDPGFNVPRARIGVRGGWRFVEFNLGIGHATPFDTLSTAVPAVQIVDAWGRLRFDSVAGTTSLFFGSHAVPFSREQNISSNDLVFQERSISTQWLTPGNDVGATLRQDWKYLSGAVGVYNGSGFNRPASLFGNPDGGVSVGGRLEAHLGGDTYRTNSSVNAFGLGASYLYNQTFSDATHRVGVDLLGRIVGLTLLGEFTWNSAGPVDEPDVVAPEVLAATQRFGAMGQLSYYGVTKVGAIEPAVRFSWLNDNTELVDNGDLGVLHAGVSWREPVPFVDIGAGYVGRFELGGRDIANDSARVWVGLRYPSHRYQPFNLVDVLRSVGAKPLANRDGDEGPSGREVGKGAQAAPAPAAEPAGKKKGGKKGGKAK